VIKKEILTQIVGIKVILPKQLKIPWVTQQEAPTTGRLGNTELHSTCIKSQRKKFNSYKPKPLQIQKPEQNKIQLFDSKTFFLVFSQELHSCVKNCKCT